MSDGGSAPVGDEEAPVTLITGAAGGIGSATARAFLAEGHRLLCVDRDAQQLASVQQTLEAPGRVSSMVADLASPESAGAIARQCVADWGRIDNVVPVAGIGQLCRTEEVGVDQWDAIHHVNLRSPFLLAQATMPALLESRGSIAAVTSIAGLQGWAYSVAYAASKAGLVTLMKSLAIEYGSFGVRVNLVAPGGVDTGMASDRQSSTDLDPDIRKRSVGLEGRRARPSEIADVLVYLTSDRATFVNGAVVPVDGGAFA